MATRHRLLAVVLLLALTLGVCVQYDRADKWSYPSAEAVSDDIDQYDGERVLLFLTVAELDRAENRLSDDDFSFLVDTTAIDAETLARLEAGSDIQVYGTVQADSNAVTAQRVVVDYQHTGDWVYLAVTSAAGLLLAVGYFLRYWRPDLSTWSFEPRGERHG